MLHGALQQFFREVRWVDLDYLVIDMPPGTGDVALSLSQTVPVAGAIVVTTPQLVSLADSRRAVAMYKKLNIPTLGIIENMSHFVCRELPPRGRHLRARRRRADGGGAWRSRSSAAFPSTSRFAKAATHGVPLLISEPDSPAARAFVAAAERMAGAGVDRQLQPAHHSAHRRPVSGHVATGVA